MENPKLKIYHGSLDKPWPLVWFLLANYPAKKTHYGRFGEAVQDYFSEALVEVVSDPALADYLLLPYLYNQAKKDPVYLVEFEALAKQHHKSIIVVYPGDSSEAVTLKHAIVFRNSQYQSQLRPNEIIMPALADDLGLNQTLAPRQKGGRPVIGFCGWADFRNLNERLRYYLKLIFQCGPARQGLWWRRKALNLLRQSKLVVTNFLIRHSYSGNEKTISLDQATARREYIDNILGSDLTLCVKGDGNFSVRFFEVLSLGRLPLFLDTDCPLPLADQINYDDFIVRLDWTKADQVASLVAETYQSWTAEEFARRQNLARSVFVDFLRLDNFFARTLTRVYLQKYEPQD